MKSPVDPFDCLGFYLTAINSCTWCGPYVGSRATDSGTRWGKRSHRCRAVTGTGRDIGLERGLTGKSYRCIIRIDHLDLLTHSSTSRTRTISQVVASVLGSQPSYTYVYIHIHICIYIYTPISEPIKDSASLRQQDMGMICLK